MTSHSSVQCPDAIPPGLPVEFGALPWTAPRLCAISCSIVVGSAYGEDGSTGGPHTTETRRPPSWLVAPGASAVGP